MSPQNDPLTGALISQSILDGPIRRLAGQDHLAALTVVERSTSIEDARDLLTVLGLYEPEPDPTTDVERPVTRFKCGDARGSEAGYKRHTRASDTPCSECSRASDTARIGRRAAAAEARRQRQEADAEARLARAAAARQEHAQAVADEAAHVAEQIANVGRHLDVIALLNHDTPDKQAARRAELEAAINHHEVVSA